MGLRKERVASEIREHISQILNQETHDPRVGFITVTKVEVTPDLRMAKIFISSIGGKTDKDNALKGLSSASGYLRKMLGERIRLRFIPELIFKIDESSEYIIHLNEIFDKIHKEKKGKDDSE